MKGKKIVCSHCLKEKEVEIVHKSSVLPGEYCSSTCYIDALCKNKDGK